MRSNELIYINEYTEITRAGFDIYIFVIQSSNNLDYAYILVWTIKFKSAI